ncbi:hypothetical protein [Spirosoma flavum]|uniref:Uncharacterized protein n=1 Tax=Spirosoma flavum TaxID=2048557 RepID=A0ABW6AH66_9BACT
MDVAHNALWFATSRVPASNRFAWGAVLGRESGGQARQKATEHLGLSPVFKRRRATLGSQALFG